MRRTLCPAVVPVLVGAVSLFCIFPATAQRMEPLPAELNGVTVTEHLGAQLPLDLVFKNEKGLEVRLKDFIRGDKPVILTLNYYGCPMLCGLQLNGLLDTLRAIEWTAGEEFEIVTVSIDPGETPILAKNKKQNYLRDYGRPEASNGWHFLTGREAEIRKLTETVGYGYTYQESTGEYLHAAVFMLLTPTGTVSRYIYGVQFDPETIRLSLVEAGEGKIGSTLDRFLLFCYHYVSSEGRYAVAAVNVMRVGGFLTVLVLAVMLWTLWRREMARGIRTVEGHIS